MKLFTKILLFIFAMLVITVGETKSSTVATILQQESLYLLPQKAQFVNGIAENHSINSCLKGEEVVTCREQGKRKKVL